MTRVIAAGMSYDRKPPAALHDEQSVTFGFPDSDGQSYIVKGPHLSIPQALLIVKARMTHFGRDRAARESFADKVARKLIAAQGEAFATRLKRKLATISHGIMEWEMMFSPKSHHSVVSLPQLKKLQESATTMRIRVNARGQVSHDPAWLTTNDNQKWEPR